MRHEVETNSEPRASHPCEPRGSAHPTELADAASQPPGVGADSFLLPVRAIVPQTADAVSVTFDVPAHLAGAFAFRPGQFLTVGIPSTRTGLAARCYSLCVPPGEPLTITVKRTPGGFASNWIATELAVGDRLRVQPPAGIFTPASLEDDLLLFAGGSGITPVLSILRTVLRDGTGRLVLFYANRDEHSVIFAERLAGLAAEHPDRLLVVHWLESVQGLPTEDQLRAFAAPYADRTAFSCGPAPYLKAVSGALRTLGLPRERRHQERFVSLGGNPFGDVAEVEAARATLAAADDPQTRRADLEPAFAGPVVLDVELDGRHHVFDDWSGSEPLLVFLESKGVKAPFSCREGQCSACAFVLLEGEVTHAHNEVLDEADLAEGLRLACQARPASSTLRISYHG